MKIFAIRNEFDNAHKDLAYLLYYEKDKRFYIELPEDADPWETPLLLSSTLKKGQKTVNAYWSRMWVQQRIVPTDRQNLGQVLKSNHLSEYDEFSLLMLANGRCAQDDYYLAPVDEKELPDSLLRRFHKKVEDVVPLNEYNLLIFFRDGAVKKWNAQKYLCNNNAFGLIVKRDDLFQSVCVQTGGHGICWGEQLAIPADTLYEEGKKIPLTYDDICSFVKNRVVNSAEAAELLDCSRQNIEDLVRRGKLHPVKTDAKSKLFLKSEILQRKWQ